MGRDARRRGVSVVVLLAVGLALAGRAGAHAGGIRAAAPESLTVPFWLFLATGGGVVGASFLLASFVTDRSFVRWLDEWRGPPVSLGRPGRLVGRLLGVVGLGLVVVAGVAGPPDPVRNAATLVVWIGFWGGLTALAYLVANPWPAVDPFATVARVLPTLDRTYPARLGSWPATVGLLALVYVEVITPLADDPTLLALVVVGYGVATVTGAVVFGPDTWFARADPLSRLLAAYGRVAPLARTDEGLRLRFPGAAGTERVVRDRSDAAFVVAVVFVTTYDGFVGTEVWQSIARPFVLGGVVPEAVYLAALSVGYGVFVAAFVASVAVGRRAASTYVTSEALLTRFAPPLLAIAAGYHLAHNVGTTLTLLPALATALTAPLATPTPPTLVVPNWFGGVGIAAVLLGHVLAVWMGHTAAYETFPDRLQAIRAQYGITLAMIAYTMISLWIVTTPGGSPPFV